MGTDLAAIHLAGKVGADDISGDLHGREPDRLHNASKTVEAFVLKGFKRRTASGNMLPTRWRYRIMADIDPALSIVFALVVPPSAAFLILEPAACARQYKNSGIAVTAMQITRDIPLARYAKVSIMNCKRFVQIFGGVFHAGKSHHTRGSNDDGHYSLRSIRQ